MQYKENMEKSSIKKPIINKRGNKTKKILFVCTGNTCRSPMAEFIFSDYLSERKIEGYQILSCGLNVTENSLNPNSQRALDFYSVKYLEHKPRQITKELIEDAFMIVCMENHHKKAITTIFGEIKPVFAVGEITNRSDISDPYGSELSIYIQTAKDIIDVCQPLLDKLETMQKPKRKNTKVK